MDDDMEPISTEMRALSGVECLLHELLVALIDSGALRRADVAKAILRAELMACSRDGKEQHEVDQSLTAAYVRVLEASLAPRLALSPELFALRNVRAGWLLAGRKGPDPIDVPKRREPSE